MEANAKGTTTARLPAPWVEPQAAEHEPEAGRRTRMRRIFVVTAEGVAVGVLTVETAWSDVERPSLRIAVAPALEGKVIAGRARVLETA